METHNVDILVSQKMVRIRDGLSEAALTPAPETANINTARTGRKINIPAMSESIIPLYLPRTVKPESTLLLEPHTTLTNRTGVIGARCVAIVNNRTVTYRVMNPTNCDIIPHDYIPEACAIDINDPSLEITNVTSSHTSVQCVDPFTVTSNSSDNKDYVKIAEDMGIKLSDNSLSDKQQFELLTCIGQKRDVFACDLSELGTTPLYEHDIDTGDHKPVRQRFYRTSPDLKQEIE